MGELSWGCEGLWDGSDESWDEAGEFWGGGWVTHGFGESANPFYRQETEKCQKREGANWEYHVPNKFSR